RLGSVERAVEAGHVLRALRAEQRTAVGPGTVEDTAQLVAGDVAGETEALGAPAEPAARRLAGADVVLLGATGDGVEVVVGPAGGELADAQHGTAPPPHEATRADRGHLGASAST